MTPEEVAIEAVDELSMSVGLASGGLLMALRKLGIRAELDKEREEALADTLIQAFIEFAQRCEVPYAKLVKLTPRLRVFVPPLRQDGLTPTANSGD